MLIQAIKIIVLITIPVTFYSLVNGRELIALLYKNKSFTEESVLLTLGEFRFHIAGLFFIAANRIISPAFYAQGNTKLPTLAGIISFVTNIIFALALVKPMSGNGIALALSMASMVNTIFLFIFMKKMESIKIKKVLKDTLIYILKITIYSVIAAIPCYLLRPTFVNLFANRSRIFSEGLPLVCSLVIFATIGIFELFITKDSITVSIVRKIKHKKVGLN